MSSGGESTSASGFVPQASRVRFVLVAPSHPGNIGAAARAIKTMGFSRLVVVAPREADFARHAEAVAFATGGQDVLAATVSVPTLEAALAGTRLSFAMTGYAREFGPQLLDMRRAAALACAEVQAEGDIAFVFGTERSGLSNEDVERCSFGCAIPADPQFASLNLAQAVQIAAYECQLALRAGAGVDAALMPFAPEPAASFEAQEAMLAHLERTLVAIGFLDPAVPRRLMSRLRRLFGRARPSQADIDILRGIFAAAVQPKRERIGRKQGRSPDPD